MAESSEDRRLGVGMRPFSSARAPGFADNGKARRPSEAWTLLRMDEEIRKKQTDGFAERGRAADRTLQPRRRLRLLLSLLFRWGGGHQRASRAPFQLRAGAGEPEAGDGFLPLLCSLRRRILFEARV